MGAQHSIIASAKVSTETANDLWRKESTKKGIKAAGALGAAILFAPAVILALPFVGAYEFGTALENELVTGYPVMDGVIGGLFGVVVSPIAPFYCFLVSIQEIFELKYIHERHPHLIDKNYLKRAEGMLRLDFSHYNVAITGCPGTGKSSILNGLLGYKESNAKAATVGEIETTLEPKFYRHPILNTLYLWDMPGVGTPRHPIENFFENYCLGAFDAILIVFDDRLMASDIDIARRAIKYDIPVFFVKNKSDLVNIVFRIIIFYC
ncbi:P-loop containing nucleoside triphosphate hydrolase protein [Helicostylum pulchrum]|nr:P-loop containing nucleoside triphosphate hydrolase protein [Helicostylum pulchrum]